MYRNNTAQSSYIHTCLFFTASWRWSSGHKNGVSGDDDVATGGGAVMSLLGKISYQLFLYVLMKLNLDLLVTV